MEYLTDTYKYIFHSVLRPFQDYFSSYETSQSVGLRRRENPEMNHLAHPQAELGLSHVASAGLEPTQGAAVRTDVKQGKNVETYMYIQSNKPSMSNFQGQSIVSLNAKQGD